MTEPGTAIEEELCLQRLFLHLIDRGFQLSVRDYLDLVKALRAGYGLHDRASLLRLCQTLWGYTEAEDRYLAFLFGQVPLPTDEEIARIMGAFKGEEDADQPASSDKKGEASVQQTTKQEAERKHIQQPQQTQQELEVSFAGRTEKGVGLPQARVAPVASESFILSPRPLIPLRILIIIFRRFRRALREGPKVELDIEATIDEQCRTGLLHAPVLVPARRNQAHLTLLVDVGSSMAAWQRFNGHLRTALQNSRLGRWALFYFDEVPGEVLYREETLDKPLPIAKILKEQPGRPVLIISEAGAARGRRGKPRVRETGHFLEQVSKVWYPLAWANPMPQSRWKGTAAEGIGKRVPMFELNEEGLVRAIDVLRGTRLGG